MTPGGKGLYLIALVPGPRLRAEVRSLKLEMQRRFGAAHALKSPAHITLQMPFQRQATEVAGLLEALEDFSRKEAPLQVRLSGFDCFAPRVLFIRVLDHGPLIGLQERLQKALARDPGFASGHGPAPFHPHMTIATRDLGEPGFYRAWEAFRERAFTASFRADHLSLLRHTGSQWGFFREFPFRAGAPARER